MKKHRIHKYHKVEFSYTEVFACALPDCSHYMPKHMESTLEGKFSYCWACGDKFILDSEALKMNKPNCYKCRSGIIESVPDEPPMTDKLRELLEHLETK